MTTIVSHLGLADRDIAMIKSIFNINPHLGNEFTFVELEKRRNHGRLADIIFINADSAQILTLWKTMAAENKLTTPIMVASNIKQMDNELTLQRPLVLKRLLAALNQAVSTTGIKKKEIDGLNILVVDDSFPVRKYMECKLPELTKKKLIIDFAADGKEATNKMSSCSYDIVFLDVVMPGTDGYKVCKYIKSRHAAHVVMLTSKKSPFDKVRGAMSGCDSYVTKPPSDEKIKKILNTYIRTHKKNSFDMPSQRPLSC